MRKIIDCLTLMLSHMTRLLPQRLSHDALDTLLTPKWPPSMHALYAVFISSRRAPG